MGEFAGGESEDVAEWLDSVEVIGQLIGLGEQEIIKASVLALREAAKSWGVAFVRTSSVMSCINFKNEMTRRFSNYKKSDETLNRFLSTPEVYSYDAYVKLLKDAKIIIMTHGVSKEHAMRQVIARSPAGLKSLLLQVAQQGVEWEEFLRQAENAAWVVFPERIVGRVSEEHKMAEIGRIDSGLKKYSNKKEHGMGSQKDGNEKLWYCHLHGKGDHSTKFCNVVKLLEKKAG
ncbi:MAG: hypothetical protein ACRC1D_02700 [Culicoidibacterales bacterium]